MDWSQFVAIRQEQGDLTAHRAKWPSFIRGLKTGEPTKVPVPRPDDPKSVANTRAQVIAAAKKLGVTIWMVMKDGELWVARPPEDPEPPAASAPLYCRETGCRGQYIDGICNECQKRRR